MLYTKDEQREQSLFKFLIFSSFWCIKNAIKFLYALR